MLLQIIILATITERLWEVIQQAIGEHYLTRATKIVGAAIISVVVSVFFQLDLFYALELYHGESIPGYIFTGFVLAFGSGFLHDIIDLVSGLSQRIATGPYGDY